MKTILLSTCLLWLFVSQGKAQMPSTDSPPLPVVQQQAQFKGGRNALAKYMQENYKQPKAVQRLGITGKVYIKFVITKKGEITQAEVTRGIENCPECNEEALRLIKMMPNWDPALQNGEPVSVYFTMPIAFKVTEDTKKKK